MKRLFAGIWNWWKTRTLGHRVILILLGLLVVGFAIYLVGGPKPWEDGVAPREESGKRIRSDHYAVDGIYKGVTISLILAVLLVPFAGIFGRRLGGEFKADERKSPGRTEALLLLVVVVGSAAITCRYAVPRFDHSLWHDEDLSMRRCIVGDHLRVGEDGLADRFGEIAKRPVRWEETLWFYESPNNHMFFSVCARLAHAMWPADGSPDKPYFNAYALRLAALVPALLTLAVLAVFLSLMGFRIAAFALPPLLAMHPWFIRYASEGRGYALAMLLISLCLLFFWRALATGKWRWFAAYGLAQFLLLFTNLASLWFLVALNGAGIFALLFGKSSKDGGSVILGRFVFANAIAGMVTLIMVMPLYLQLKLGHGEIAYGFEVFQNMAGAFLTGMRWVTWSELDFVVSIEKALVLHPVAVVAFLVGIVSLALAGLIALARKGWRHALLIPVILLPAPLFLGFNYWSGSTLYHWYTVNLLPLLWISVAIGIGYIAALIGGKSERRETVAGGVLILVIGVSSFWMGADQRQMQMDVPLERSLESVKATRDVLDPFDPEYKDVITVGFMKYTRAYDPGHYRVRTGDEMRRMMEKADAEGKPLFVNDALPDFARDHKPDIMEILDDKELFEDVGQYFGMEETATRYVKKYIPGSLKSKTNP